MNFNSILIGSEQPERLSSYYTALFGEPEWQDQGFSGWRLGSGFVSVGPHDGVKGQSVHPGRVIWNIETSDVPGDFDRLRSAGATVVREPYNPAEEGDWLVATFSDPDGNFFQLVSPM